MPVPGRAPHLPPPRFFLAIPAYREARRLPPFLRELRAALSGIAGGVQIQIVDDGSPIEEWETLRAAMEADNARAPATDGGACTVLPPLRLAKNTRKGGAVLSAWLQAHTASWLVFLDADGAVPAGEVFRVLDEIDQNDSGAFFASRAAEAGTGAARAREVHRTLPRRLQSAAFGFIARRMLGVSFGDSQCGFKIVRASDFDRIAPDLRPHGFCFDLALWLALSRVGLPVKEIPVRWEERSGGHLSPFRHGPGILRDLLALRREHFATREEIKAPRRDVLSLSA